MSLEDVRVKIDEIDRELLRLLSERAEQVHLVGEIKRKDGLEFYAPEREEKLLRKLAGINALISIAINLTVLLGIMAYAGATMTLPGIAGFILTIGMGVDSNVLIFERIKEELAAQKGVKQAIAAGFDRVFLTILDTHVASLIAAAFLFQFGTGPIRGFATTLSIGLLSNVFTSVFVSRTLFELVLSRRRAATLSI